MELVPFKGNGGKLGFGDLHTGGVGVLAGDGRDGEPDLRGGGTDGLDDDLVVGQRPAAPVDRDEGEEPALYLVPLRGAGSA
jgi:hypothetical protein